MSATDVVIPTAVTSLALQRNRGFVDAGLQRSMAEVKN
jgi:hypothetical protein